MKKIIEEIEQDIVDIVNTDFDYNDTTNVPNLEDTGLTYANGEAKKGKLLKTCVLFVDIRSSVALTKKHTTQTMGRVYSAFTKGVLKAAHYHNGFIRNIIGDRVMVVFPAENCFTNAVNCAISINHIAHKIIDKQFKNVDFKCGIGIDYGELKVIKVGTRKHGEELNENKGLVWVGYPANLASRLTDVANKEVLEEYFLVTYNPLNMAILGNMLGLLTGEKQNKSNLPTYLEKEETKTMTPVDFANSMTCKDGKLDMIGIGGKFIKFEKKKRKFKHLPILMTRKVFEGFKKANPNRKSIKENYWKRYLRPIKDVKEAVYQGNVTWII